MIPERSVQILEIRIGPLRKRGCWGGLTLLQQVPNQLVDWMQTVKFLITLVFVIDLRETSIRSAQYHTAPMFGELLSRQSIEYT